MSNEGPDGGGFPVRRFLIEAAAVALLFAAVQQVQVLVKGYGDDRDAGIYLDYAHRWIHGEVPYADFDVEYPPGAMLLFIVPLLFIGANFGRYRMAFGVEMGFFNTAIVLLVLAFAWRRWPGSLARRGAAVGLHMLLSIILTTVVFRRFDAAPAALIMGALLAPPVIGAGFLGLAASMKLWPVMLLPLLFADMRRETWRRAAAGLGLFSIGLLLPFLPFVLRSGTAVLGFLRYHAARGVQVESFWALPILALHSLGWVKADWNWEFGSNNLVSAAAGWVVPLSTVTLAALVLAPLVVLRIRGEPGSIDARVRAAAAMVAGLLLGSKVLSPQFFLWLAPLLAVAAVDMPWKKGLAFGTMSLAAGWLTMRIYEDFYANLCDGPRGMAYAVSCVRLAVFIGLYAMTVLPVRLGERRT
jgi:uncharacterized membrane protein